MCCCSPVQVPSTTMKFCRAGNVCECSVEVRDRNHHPVRIKPGEDNELAEVWSNEVPILWEFCFKYLVKGGLTASSKGVDDLFAYAFHGRYTYIHTRKDKAGKGQKKRMEKPIIHALHFNLTAHRSRFTTNVDKHFRELYKLLDKNPSWENLLDDEGEGEAPRDYLIAVEMGARSYAFDKRTSKLTMGIGPTREVTRMLYGEIRAWRKYECYIAGVRFRRSRTTYRKWEDFSWTDYTERNKLYRTYMNRHFKLSDGEDHFGGELKDPPQWADPRFLSSTPTTTKKSSGKTKSKKKTKKTTVKVEPKPSSVPMKFDEVKGCLVPFVMDLTR